LISPLETIGGVVLLVTRGSKLLVDFKEDRRMRPPRANGEKGRLVGLDGLVGQVDVSSSVDDKGTSR
jgi:hypothetical protein